MLECRRWLPAYKQRDAVLSAISQNQVCKEENGDTLMPSCLTYISNEKLNMNLDILACFVFVPITHLIFGMSGYCCLWRNRLWQDHTDSTVHIRIRD